MIGGCLFSPIHDIFAHWWPLFSYISRYISTLFCQLAASILVHRRHSLPLAFFANWRPLYSRSSAAFSSITFFLPICGRYFRPSAAFLSLAPFSSIDVFLPIGGRYSRPSAAENLSIGILVHRRHSRPSAAAVLQLPQFRPILQSVKAVSVCLAVIV